MKETQPETDIEKAAEAYANKAAGDIKEMSETEVLYLSPFENHEHIKAAYMDGVNTGRKTAIAMLENLLEYSMDGEGYYKWITHTEIEDIIKKLEKTADVICNKIEALQKENEILKLEKEILEVENKFSPYLTDAARISYRKQLYNLENKLKQLKEK